MDQNQGKTWSEYMVTKRATRINRRGLPLSRVLSPNRAYIFLDWTASGVSFVNLLLLYRAAASPAELGRPGWLLNLLMTSLFVSAAAQYFSMFTGAGVWRTYISFVPVLLIETVVLVYLSGAGAGLALSLALVCNVLFAAYRGHLMGTGRMVRSSVCNLVEQLMRVSCFWVALRVLGLSLESSLLLSTAAAYSTLALYSAVASKSDFSVSAASFGGAFRYALAHALLYLTFNLDVLVLRDLSCERDWFLLLKPWGQVFFVAATPLVNLYLLDSAKRRQDFLWAVCGMAVAGSALGWVLAEPVESVLFGKKLLHTWAVPVVIAEHLCIVLLVSSLYEHLRGNNIRRLPWAQIVFVPVVPLLLNGYWVVIGYLAAYGTALVLHKVFSNREEIKCGG